MTDVHKLLVLSGTIAMVCLAPPARANEACGRAPVFDHTKVETTGSLVLNFLKGLVGKGDAQGSVTTTPEDVLHQYPNPDKLLPRITVFIIMCNSVMDDATLDQAQKRLEILSIYNQVFLRLDGSERARNVRRFAAFAPNGSSTMSDATTSAAPDAAHSSIPDQVRAKETWQQKWFHESFDGSAPSDAQGKYHVIVASPCGEDTAQEEIGLYNKKYPDIYFELWRTVGKCYFAITVGTGLEQAQAKRLLELVKQRGMNGYLWHW
jgi:hypothetical protein